MVRGSALGEERKTIWTWLHRPWSFSLSSETFTWLAVVIGIMLRTIEYTDNRPLYKDEISLLENLVGRPLFDFHTILTQEQLAPPGFLVTERMMVRLPIEVKLAGRLVPFVCGIVSMFLFRSIARRYLTPCAVPIAVGLFALADWMLYYSVEMKQYSGDVALTLVALLMAAGPASRSADWPATMSRRWLLALAGFGVLGVWFSYPLALVLAGAGTYLIGEAALRRDWNKATGFCRDQRDLGFEFRDLLQGLSSNTQQGTIHLELVGLRVLADTAALDRGAETGALATGQRDP